MVHLITKGIKISVQSEYRGNFSKNHRLHYAFSYTIEIENQSQKTVQLRSRFWTIKDSLNNTSTVKGDGVVGQQPVLLPGERHTYTSGCLLCSAIGAMTGHYNLVNLDTQEEFKVAIPLFKLHGSFTMN